MIPKLWGRERMHSVGLINAHFWLATIGTVLYIASMWVNGITQGLMWRAINEDGTLTYSFVEALVASHPGYVVRLLGGATFGQRHAADGLQHLADPAQRAGAAAAGPGGRPGGLNMLLSLLCLSTLVLGLALSLAGSTRRGTRAGRPAAVRRRSRGRPPGRPGYRQDLPAGGPPPRGIPRGRRPAVPRLNRLHHPGMDASSTKVPCGAGNGPFLSLRRVP
ncbi:cbb3-type cytochrome c oxidase subunit I [Pseudomonas aeruginosa]|nr:cbb3-type cytochrome c oxidase subunit I [Pseudomonas aeruginosa]